MQGHRWVINDEAALMQTSSRQSTPSIIMDSHGIFIHLNQTLNPALIIDRVRGQPGIQSITARWILGLGRVVKIVEEIDNCVIETFSASLLLPPQTRLHKGDRILPGSYSGVSGFPRMWWPRMAAKHKVQSIS